MRKFLSILLALVMTLSMTACNSGDTQTDGGTTEANSGQDQEGNTGDKLVVWTFSDELKGMIENHYLKDNPDLPYDVEVVVVPNDNYQQKLDPALASGKSAPDVFALEAAYVKKYVDSDFTADLATIGIDKNNVDTLQYVMDVATDEQGLLKGISWQATPGAFFYRRSLAEQFLGTSDPAEVQAMVSDFDKFYDVAKKINAESGGEVKAISSLGDLTQIFFAARESGWVADGKFVIDPVIYDLFEMSKKLESEGLTNEAEQWTETWFSSMSGNDVFGYFLPTWGLHYVLKENAENADSGATTFGDWAMIQGPAPYFWGGTWLAMREGTPMQDAAKDLIDYLALNETFLTTWAKETGDFVSNPNVVGAIKDDFSEDYLGGQNHYAAFADMAPAIDASILTGSDKDIQDVLNEELTAYAKGEKDLDTAIADFTTAVKNRFPNLTY